MPEFLICNDKQHAYNLDQIVRAEHVDGKLLVVFAKASSGGEIPEKVLTCTGELAEKVWQWICEREIGREVRS
jgi:hypothetical protein